MLVANLLFLDVALNPPTSYAPWVPLLGLGCIALATVIGGWVFIASRIFPTPNRLLWRLRMYEVAARTRAHYLSDIAHVRNDVRDGHVSVRNGSQQLTAIMRALATEVTQTNIEVATLEECERLLGQRWPALIDFLRRCEEPSFAAHPPQHTIDELCRSAETIVRESTLAADTPPRRHWWNRRIPAMHEQKDPS